MFVCVQESIIGLSLQITRDRGQCLVMISSLCSTWTLQCCKVLENLQLTFMRALLHTQVATLATASALATLQRNWNLKKMPNLQTMLQVQCKLFKRQLGKYEYNAMDVIYIAVSAMEKWKWNCLCGQGERGGEQQGGQTVKSAWENALNSVSCN